MTAATEAQALVELAVAVADPDSPVLLLREGPRGTKVRAGWTDLATLAVLADTEPERFRSRSFAVTVADDVLAIDCDTPDAVAAAEQIADWCDAAGTPAVIVRSGREGHLHLWCRVEAPGLHRSLVRHAAAAGADVRTGARMRPPGSAHPSGRPVHVDGGLGRALELLRVDANHRRHITAADTRSARAEGRAQRHGDNVVVLPTSADPAASTAARLSAAPLSAHTLSVLRNGDGDTDRSATLQRILVGMVNRGWTFDAAWDAMCVRRHRGAAKLHEKLERRGPDAARAYLAHCWASALAWVEANPPVACDPDDAARIEALLLEADTHRWSGEAGAAAWMVLHALCVIGHRGPGVVLGASERDLAERCALSRATVHRALQTLQDRGWITCWETGRGPVASTWRLEVDDRPLREAARTDEPLPQPPTPHSTVGGVVENGLTMRAGADAFRRDALGPNGYRVLRLLLLWGPQSRTALAERLGLHPGTIARVLERCAATGLAERRPDASWALTEHADADQGAAEAAAPHDVDPVTGEIATPTATPTAAEGRLEEATARTTRPHRRRGAYLACEPSALAAAAVAHGTLGAAARQRALHASERAVYAQSAAYHAAARALRRAAPAARHHAVAA